MVLLFEFDSLFGGFVHSFMCARVFSASFSRNIVLNYLLRYYSTYKLLSNFSSAKCFLNNYSVMSMYFVRIWPMYFSWLTSTDSCCSFLNKHSQIMELSSMSLFVRSCSSTFYWISDALSWDLPMDELRVFEFVVTLLN